MPNEGGPVTPGQHVRRRDAGPVGGRNRGRGFQRDETIPGQVN